jgi:hypothetical protein
MTDPAFSFDGRPVPIRPGDTIAAALFRAGIATGRITRAGEDRGPFCGIGLCHDCLVAVDGRAGQRACMVRAEPGAVVRRHSDVQGAPAPTRSRDWPPCPRAEACRSPPPISPSWGRGLRASRRRWRRRAGGFRSC